MELKRVKVIMLPGRSGEKCILIRNHKLEYEKRFMTQSYLESMNIKLNHLYLYSDEAFNENDWYYDAMQSIVRIGSNNHIAGGYKKKIIATTDKSLMKKLEVPYGQIHHHNNNFNGIIIQKSGKTYKYLPQPSEAFIQKYCKLGGIDEVDVEYTHGTWDYDEILKSVFKYKLKINSHNEIAIHSIKNSWDKEEVITLLNKYCKDTYDKYLEDQEIRNDWIKQNL